eukprot:comp16742_c0_seq1/m.15058 comp16742_c0_seq1/g.15058  ORF comp16742_c0_seq1/g.15058 comp16742_c0_seq1/m.15058 type:complete len:632 (-) comp16742_c0_seq1:519-2414(-)
MPPSHLPGISALQRLVGHTARSKGSATGVPRAYKGSRHPRDIPANGLQIIQDPVYNKGSAYTRSERQILGLTGLLPPRTRTWEEMQGSVFNKLNGMNDLDQYSYLMGLQDRNQKLFFQCAVKHLKTIMPIIYTPTVAAACQAYSRIFRRPRGLYVSIEDRGNVRALLDNWPERSVRAIVLTDGERILGLGDLGSQGMPIPVGKLNLYVACGGLDPQECLPIMLDVGTNNEALLNDPLYIGLPQKRVTGQPYDDLVAELMDAVKDKYGASTLVQFEDFGNHNAFRLLDRFKDTHCCFNDDIQGTASVTLAGIYSALRLEGTPKFRDAKFLFLGAGEAGTGIGDLIVRGLMEEGLSEAEARRRCWFVDSQGLVVKDRLAKLQHHKIPYAHDHQRMRTLLEAVHSIKPHAIIGVSGMPDTFTQEVIEAMCQYNKRPIVFALSNPTSKAECTAEQAIQWSKGRAIFASGSPFDPVTYKGKEYVPGQGNNAYIFPGVGLGVTSVGSTRVTDEMFMAAAKSLAADVTEADLAKESVYPPLEKIRVASLNIATKVAEVALNRGFCEPKYLREIEEHMAEGFTLRQILEAQMWYPDEDSRADMDVWPLIRSSAGRKLNVPNKAEGEESADENDPPAVAA